MVVVSEAGVVLLRSLLIKEREVVKMSRVLTIGLCLLIIGGVAVADFVGYDPSSRNEMPGTGWEEA